MTQEKQLGFRVQGLGFRHHIESWTSSSVIGIRDVQLCVPDSNLALVSQE